MMGGLLSLFVGALDPGTTRDTRDLLYELPNQPQPLETGSREDLGSLQETRVKRCAAVCCCCQRKDAVALLTLTADATPELGQPLSIRWIMELQRVARGPSGSLQLPH